MGEKYIRAGAIPWCVFPDGVLRIMLMIPSDPDYGGNDPQIAKGRIDPGMDEESTARKEIEEELGARESNLLSFNYLGYYLNSIHVYTTEVKDYTAFDTPHYETKAVVWLSEREIGVARDIHRQALYDAFSVISGQLCS